MKTFIKTIIALVAVEIISVLLGMSLVAPIGWSLHNVTSLGSLILWSILGSFLFVGILRIVLPLACGSVYALLSWFRMGRVTAVPLIYALLKICKIIYLLFCVIWQFDMPSELIIEENIYHTIMQCLVSLELLPIAIEGVTLLIVFIYKITSGSPVNEEY